MIRYANMETKPPTIAHLKGLLQLGDVAFSSKAKLADLRKLCEDNGLIARPPPNFKMVEKICVVKCALKRAMNLDEEQFDKFRGHVDDLVNVVSRMLRRSSLVMSFHFTKLAEMEGSEGVLSTIPNLYDMKDTYWKNWLKIGVDGVFPDKESKVSYEALKDVLDKVVDKDDADYIDKYPKHFDQVLNYAGHTLSTVVSNNAWVPLPARLTRLTTATLKSLNAPQSTYTVMQAIRSEVQEMEGWPVKVKEYVNEVRTRLKVPPGTRVYDTYGKENLEFSDMLRFNYWMQTRLETLEQRRIRIMPIFDVHRVHVRLDLKTLVKLFKDMFPTDSTILALAKTKECRNPNCFMLPERPPYKKKTDCKTPNEWEAYKLAQQTYKDEVADIKAGDPYISQKATHTTYVDAQRAVATSFFKNLPVKKGWVFDCSVATDGVSVSLQYSKKVMVCVAVQGKSSIGHPPNECDVTESYARNGTGRSGCRYGKEQHGHSDLPRRQK